MGVIVDAHEPDEGIFAEVIAVDDVLCRTPTRATMEDGAGGPEREHGDQNVLRGGEPSASARRG